jgi:hypothetical protein
MRWYDIVGWILQAAGAGSAVWGLYASETSRVSGPSGGRRLTARGRAALLAVLAGVCGFGLNQWKDLNRGADAERDRRAAIDRADAAAATLARVRDEQEKQTASQVRQISFLRHLSLVQQQLSGLEFSWAQSSAIRQRTVDVVRQEMEGGFPNRERWKPTGSDVYFEPCVLYSQFVLTRRPNDSWRLDCSVSRPQGMLAMTYELVPGDRKTIILDRFLDALLSPQFVLRTTAGDDIVALSTAARPSLVERRTSTYVVRVMPANTRFSAFDAGDLVFRMDVTDRSLLPERIRVRSLDPLAVFDQEFQLGWEIKTAEVVRRFVDPGDTEPIEIERKAAFSRPVRLQANFERLLNPDVVAPQ